MTARVVHIYMVLFSWVHWAILKNPSSESNEDRASKEDPTEKEACVSSKGHLSCSSCGKGPFWSSCLGERLINRWGCGVILLPCCSVERGDISLKPPLQANWTLSSPWPAHQGRALCLMDLLTNGHLWSKLARYRKPVLTSPRYTKLNHACDDWLRITLKFCLWGWSRCQADIMRACVSWGGWIDNFSYQCLSCPSWCLEQRHLSCLTLTGSGMYH